MLKNRTFRNKDKAYEAPGAEVLVYHVERNFLTDSPQTQDNYYGNYNLENEGPGYGGDI